VDLLEINLFSGHAMLYKYGAAPSYLVRNGKMRRIKSRSFSLGLEKAGEPDKTELCMGDGDRLLMLSDGALLQNQDDWILPALDECAGLSARDTARRLLETVTGRQKAEDDMTVLSIAMESRK